MPKKIRFIKDCDGGNKGEIKNYSAPSADSLVDEGYAEYVSEPKKSKKKTPVSDTPISTGDSIKKTKKKSQESKQESNETSETSETSDICHLLHVSRYFNSLFSDTKKDAIIKHFCATKNTPISVGKLSEILGEKKNSIKTAIYRNKGYFYDTSVRGKEGEISLKQVVVDELMEKIDDLEAQQKQIQRATVAKKQREKQAAEYLENLQKVAVEMEVKREGNTIFLDFEKVLEEDRKMADDLLDNPEKFIEAFKKCFSKDYEVRIIHLPKSTFVPIEGIRKEHINKIITVEGRVTSFGEVRPVLRTAKFECPGCGTKITIQQNYRRNELDEPSYCSCGRKNNFTLSERQEVNACRIQLEDLQERTDNPHSQRIKSIIFNGLCEPESIKQFTPGNEVEAIGILKRVPKFKNKKQTLFSDWVLEIQSVQLIEKEIDISSFTKEELNEINNLSKDINENGLEPILPSFAPDVHGYEDIKGALILQLCNRRNNKKVYGSRNKSNILLIGDPGVAKSVMCNFAVDITPGARKAVGGGSSAVGITASVVRDEESMGGYRVEPGAMVLAKDLLFIDELNNLQDEDKPKLQEGMNEQTVSINKANLHVQMKVSAGVIAAANPIGGHFSEGGDKSVEEQFNIPTPIINRFDTIFVMTDRVHNEKDMQIAEKMIKRHRGIKDHSYDKEILRKFFAYIKQQPEPEVDDEVQKKLQQVYAAARSYDGQGVKINPRFLESLTRMSCSSAKLRQSKKIMLKDIKVAMRVLSASQYKISEYVIDKLEFKEELK